MMMMCSWLGVLLFATQATAFQRLPSTPALRRHAPLRAPVSRLPSLLRLSQSLPSECFLPEDLIPTSRLIELLQYCSITDRGQTATDGQKGRVRTLLVDILDSEPGLSFDLALLDGEWKLVYASEAAYRSSPFFWAFRQMCEGMSSPVLAPQFAEAMFALTDGIPFQSVGQVKQTLSGSSTEADGFLKSEVTLGISLFDAVVPRGQSVMTTTAQIKGAIAQDDDVIKRRRVLDLTVLATEVKESTLAKVPGFGFLDEVKFPTKRVFDVLAASGVLPKEGSGGGGDGGDSQSDDGLVVAMSNVVFAGGSMRVAYAPDGNFFIWSRVGPTPDLPVPSNHQEESGGLEGPGSEGERPQPGNAGYDDSIPDS